jgi:hypothetical protein
MAHRGQIRIRSSQLSARVPAQIPHKGISAPELSGSAFIYRPPLSQEHGWCGIGTAHAPGVSQMRSAGRVGSKAERMDDLRDRRRAAGGGALLSSRVGYHWQPPAHLHLASSAYVADAASPDCASLPVPRIMIASHLRTSCCPSRSSYIRAYRGRRVAEPSLRRISTT